jgi:hypothetical protein
MEIATVLGVIALIMAAAGIIAVLRERLVLASALIAGGLALGLGTGTYFD